MSLKIPKKNEGLFGHEKKYIFKNSEIYFRSTFSLPIFYRLKDTQINYIVKQLNNFPKI